MKGTMAQKQAFVKRNKKQIGGFINLFSKLLRTTAMIPVALAGSAIIRHARKKQTGGVIRWLPEVEADARHFANALVSAVKASHK